MTIVSLHFAIIIHSHPSFSSANLAAHQCDIFTLLAGFVELATSQPIAAVLTCKLLGSQLARLRLGTNLRNYIKLARAIFK